MSARRRERENNPKQKAITDFFPARRSQRKADQSVKAEKQELLIRSTLEEVQDGLKVNLNLQNSIVIHRKTTLINHFSAHALPSTSAGVVG